MQRRTLGLGLVLLLGMTVASGCSKKILITQYPTFYTSDLKTVAVVPFRNATGNPSAALSVTDPFAAMLASNGTYRVYNRNDLKTLLDQQDLQIALGSDPAAAAMKFQKIGDVQAIIVGTVSTYSATRNTQRRRDPQYQYNPNTRTNYIAGYRSYSYTRNEGNVAVTASLIRVSDGTTIYATPAPLSAMQWAQGEVPPMDANACLSVATANVARQLVKTFALTRTEIKIDEGKALRTATELYDNKWTYSDRFSADDGKMYVVVSLPSCCDRNRFKITIVRNQQRETLAEQEITWKAKHNSFGYLFNPKQIAEKGGGPGDYLIKFYSGPEPVMTRKFSVR